MRSNLRKNFKPNTEFDMVIANGEGEEVSHDIGAKVRKRWGGQYEK
jgi:hypothetical protein